MVLLFKQHISCSTYLKALPRRLSDIGVQTKGDMLLYLFEGIYYSSCIGLVLFARRYFRSLCYFLSSSHYNVGHWVTFFERIEILRPKPF